MNINSIVNQINTANISGDSNSDITVSSDAKLSMIEQSLQNGFDILNSLSVGSTITGKIIMSEEDMILLSLGSNKLIEAKVSSDIIPKEGQLMTFLVNSNSSKNISLSPMFVNTNTDSNISAALKNAGLPDNPKMQYMVKAMMEEGLPISKESLFAMNKQINELPEYDPKILAAMKRLDIPINQSMVSQFGNYLNYEHQITSSLEDVSNAFTQSVSVLSENENISSTEILTFAKDVIENLFAKDAFEVNEEVQKDMGGFSEKEGVSNFESSTNVMEAEHESDSDSNSNITEFVKANQTFKNTINGLLTDIDNLINDKIPENEKNRLTHDVISLLKDDDFKEAFKETLKEKFLLKPEDVSQKDNISSLYERLNTQIKSLTGSLTANSLNNTSLGEAVNNINNNLNFMNELNQTFNYVQIPLKLNNKDASGELCVYTNKKSLAQKDGNVTALLHLDMDNLGPVDVHVMMNEAKNVKTKFVLKDDASLDLIAANIDILNKRLENRGYSMSSEFVTKDDSKSVFETMIEGSKNISVISTSSFDAKA